MTGLRARGRGAAVGSYAWPGNVRELENAIERAVLLAEGTLVTVQRPPGADLGHAPRSPSARRRRPGSRARRTSRSSAPCAALEEQLHPCSAAHAPRGNRTRAAELLEISHRALLYKIKEYGIDADAEGELGVRPPSTQCGDGIHRPPSMTYQTGMSMSRTHELTSAPLIAGILAASRLHSRRARWPRGKRNNVQRLREEQLLSKAELARRAGVSVLTIDAWSAGRSAGWTPSARSSSPSGCQRSDRTARKVVRPTQQRRVKERGDGEGKAGHRPGHRVDRR